ncbi:MAG: ribonuclease PH [Pseudomonadota bacterium]|nr:ribonuclease PH [Pseudomonadota bacterium]
MSRNSGRKDDEKRQVEIVTGFNPFAEGSCLIKCGNTHVVCTATVEDKVPSWLKGQEKGWVTAEYAMLPRATLTRVPRETKKPSGRSQEIQRLVGRALRAGVDLEKMPEISVTIDCDVLQADGGTRTASITGGFVALYQALQKMVAAEKLPENPVREFVAAISCGICDGAAVLDLDYAEDSSAQADTNFVLTESGKIVEIQGTAEGQPFDESQFAELMRLARKGIGELIAKQKEALGV